MRVLLLLVATLTAGLELVGQCGAWESPPQQMGEVKEQQSVQPSEEKRKPFVRLGKSGFVRLGKNDNTPAKTPWQPRQVRGNSGFVRLGKSPDGSLDLPLQWYPRQARGNSGFVRLGKSTLNDLSRDARTSGFVRLGRPDYDELGQGAPFDRIDRNSGFVRLGRPNWFERDDRSSGFVRLGRPSWPIASSAGGMADEEILKIQRRSGGGVYPRGFKRYQMRL